MDKDKTQEVKGWFERRKYTLDLAGLTEEQRRNGSIFLGGSIAKFVEPGDKFEYSEVNTILFSWGDPAAETTIAKMLEHDDNPREEMLFPFSAATVLGNELWHLAVQSRTFVPQLAYRSDDQWFELPYDEERAIQRLEEYMAKSPPSPELIGKVGTRFVLFELGLDIDE